MNRNLIESKLHEIAKTIISYIQSDAIDKNSDDNIGSFSGHMGILLFLKTYIHNYPDNDKEQIISNYEDRYLENLSKDVIEQYTFCNGLAGIFSCLGMLDKLYLSNVDYSEFAQAYSKTLRKTMNSYFSNGDYDFLHGAMGVLYSYSDNPIFIADSLEWLEKLAVRDENKLKWKSQLGENQGIGYNISLSHGISSIVIILCRCLEAGIEVDRLSNLIVGACNYILSQEINYNEYGCYFPAQSLENGDEIFKSRIAWCYGDLGVAITLMIAGRYLNREEWIKKSADIIKFSAKRLDLQDAMVYDAGLCHGAAGNAMMFKYLFDEIGLPETLDAYNFWLDMTLKYSVFEDGLAGYKTYSHSSDNPWLNDFSILTGISGIGMVINSALSNEYNAWRWRELLLLTPSNSDMLVIKNMNDDLNMRR